MGNAQSDSVSFSDEVLGDIWHDTTDDEEDGPLLETTEARESAGGAPTGSASVKSQQSLKPSEKGSEKPSEKPSEKASEKPSAKATEKPNWAIDEDLCGLEAYGKGAPWEGPQRIKASQLDDGKRKYFQKLLDKCFHPDTIVGKLVVFSPEEIIDVIDAVIPYLESEPMLIEDVPFDVTIVGDLHGQLYDLHRLFDGDSKDGKPGWECMTYVFLGDYVDRGRQSIEVMMALFIIKCMHPDRVFLLRGNHEFLKVNKRYGFFIDFVVQYQDYKTARYLYLLFNEAFTWMSIAAIVGTKYWCAHGGISPSAFTRRHMRGLYKPVYLVNEHTIIQDITWSDPAGGLRGTAFNKDRAGSIFFGFDELCKALASMEVVAVFRGHTHLTDGFFSCWNSCFTLFTATDYEGLNTPGSVAYIDPTGKVQIQMMDVDPNRKIWEAKLGQIEYINAKKTKEEKKLDPCVGRGMPSGFTN